MGSLGDELSLGSRRHSSMPTTILKIMNVKKLEEEMRKIQGSDLQLPLCLQILNDAIWYLKKEEKDNKRCSEMDTQPLLKDFISGDSPLLKREELVKDNVHISNGRFSDKNKKLDSERNEEKPLNGLSMLLKTPEVGLGLGLGLASSSMVNGGRRKEIASCGFTSNSVPQPPLFLQQQALRKQRRCWNPELHRRFVDALQQLGGPGVATPKQIREHMQEEGLTNDEVKSHLQKYRLHIRKHNSNPEKQSVVVLGFNLWNSSSQEEEKETGEGGESSKIRNSQSDSPQGPLHLPCTTTTTTGGDSSMEDAEDAKSETFQIWRD